MLNKKHLTAVITLFASFLSLLFVIITAKMFGLSTERLHSPDHVFSPLVVTTILAILLLPIVIVFLVQTFIHKQSMRQLGFKPSIAKPMLIGTVLGLTLKAVSWVFAATASPEVSLSWVLTLGSLIAALPYLGWFFVTLFLNSFNEELIYRAYAIENGKGAFRLPDWTIAVAAAILFSAMHFLIEPPEPGHFFYRLAFGLLTGFVYLKQRNLWTIVGIHNGWNFAAITVSDNADWRLGRLVQISGVASDQEIFSNVIVLTVAAGVAFFWLRTKATQSKQDTSIKISSGIAKPLLEEIKAFYVRQGYTGPTLGEDKIVVAKSGKAIVGVVRLVEEQGHALLRGMYIDDAMQRRGIGMRMLDSFQDMLTKNKIREAYLICGPHLISFYGSIGFKPVENSGDAPEFLFQRSAGYAQTYGTQLVMKRTHGQNT